MIESVFLPFKKRIFAYYLTSIMKRAIIFIISIIMPLIAGAQAQIDTKKVKISDFTQKVTKVVLNGNEFMDITFQDEITARWRISPFEFCTLEEFEKIKSDENYYFLMITYGQFRKETAPGMQFLTLVKGGKGAEKGIGDMLEVVSIPFASAEYPSGRELVFLPAFLDIIQNHTLAAMESDYSGYNGLASNNGNIGRSDGMQIVFSEDDLAFDVTPEFRESLAENDIIVAEEDDADGYLIDNAPGTLVSYVAAPTEPVAGSFCYMMLIDTQSHKLYYYKKHRIGKKAGAGFMQDDVERIKSHRR